MSQEPAEQRIAKNPDRPWRVHAWSIWEMPLHLVVSIVLVELVALGLTALHVVSGSAPEYDDLFRGALLVGLGLVHTECVARTERVRRRVSIPHYINMTSVWIFAGALVLPPVLAVLLAVVLQLHIWIRTARPRVPYYRNAFTTATMVLACLAAAGVTERIHERAEHVDPDLLGMLLALLVFTAVNTALVAGAIALSTPDPSVSTMVGHWDDNVLEVAMLSLGALVATVLMVNPWLVLLVLPLLLVLHRAVLVRHLEEAATTDGKTGLLNAAAWHTRAEQRLSKRSRRDEIRAVLVLDLDHFKEVNDSHGHLAGDQVLAAVASVLQAEVRSQDLVGRFGGEEFVVLLTAAADAEQELAFVAERIRRRVADLQVEVPTADGPLTVEGLSVSVGGSVHPRDGHDLRALLQVADSALYAVKRAGRNAVRMSTTGPPRSWTGEDVRFGR